MGFHHSRRSEPTSNPALTDTADLKWDFFFFPLNGSTISLAGKSIIFSWKFSSTSVSILLVTQLSAVAVTGVGGAMPRWTGTSAAVTPGLPAFPRVTPVAPRKTQSRASRKKALQRQPGGGRTGAPGVRGSPQQGRKGCSHGRAPRGRKRLGSLKANGSRQSQTGLCASLRIWLLFLNFSLNGGWI